MANSIQTITRTAAIIYAEDQSSRTIKSVRRTFVDALLVNSNNEPKTIEEITSSLLTEYELVFQEKDLQSILDDIKYYEVIINQQKINNKYYLPTTRFNKLKERADYNIDNAIDDYIRDCPSIVAEKLKKLLNTYLYSLLNTNISAFKQLLERKGSAVSSLLAVLEISKLSSATNPSSLTTKSLPS